MPVAVDLSKLSNVLKTKVIKKTVCNKFVAKVNNIDTSGFVPKTKHDADKAGLEKKILDASKLVKKSDYNDKIIELENKIPSISGLVTTSALTAVGNKISNVSSLVKKQVMTQKLVNLKRKLLIIVMKNILLTA